MQHTIMTFRQPEKKWQIRELPSDTSETQVKNIAQSFNVPEPIARIIALRGILHEQSINEFLAPSLTQLPRPQLMKGMNEAVVILLEALKFQKPITIFGDFDADGVTATAVLSLFFTDLGVPLHVYIPDRMTEGYGLNSKAVKKICDHNISKWGDAGTLLTVDCGISDADVIGEAKELGFKVIITDHHKPPEKLPLADAILNPLQHDCPFPCKNLAGVGVAFYLLLGIRSELVAKKHWPEDKIPNLKSFMDLVAIGTVADQVPVTGCNRIIVKAGLEILNMIGRVGLVELLDISKSYARAVSVEDIAFRIAPRINAVGRIGSAHKAVKLMTTSIREEAQQFAGELEEANNARKSIEANIVSEAVLMVSAEVLDKANSLVLYKDDWHQGVLGIVASKLSEQFNRPTILLTDSLQEERGGSKKLAKGSGRSIDGIDIHQAVSSCQEMLQRFGGHSGAVGLTLPADNIESFRQRFDTMIVSQTEIDSLIPSLFIDMQTTLIDLADQEFLAAYTSLAPFGTANPEPVFCIKSQKLSNLRLVGTNHLRFSITADGRLMNGIGFGFGDHVNTSRNSLMDLAFTLRLNSYMGQEKWEINLVDLRPSAT
jgi:single-stranded-DNA-specific exonuclease